MDSAVNGIVLPGLEVVLINLDRSVERRQLMEQRLREIGLAYRRLSAVDGQARWAEISPQLDTKAFQRNVGRDVLRGEVGCYFSHLQAWQQLLESSADTLLVLEDDVVFGQDFMVALELALAHRGDWDVLKLNKIRAKQPVRQRRLGGYSLNAYIGTATGMGAYLIQRHTVQQLLPVMLPIRRPIDHELDRVHVLDYRLFGLEPFPSDVRDNRQSTITGSDFSAVRKYPWYRRLPVYGQRVSTLFGRLIYLARKGRLFVPLIRR
jgi:glycosyl transferase family 25